MSRHRYPRPDHLAFALRLHAALPGTDAGTVWSPASVAGALGLLALGTRGATRAELDGLLGADLDGHLRAIDDAASGAKGLAAATDLWVRADLDVRPEFAAALRERPDSGLHAADFAGDPEGVRRAVNARVAETTRGLIPDLLAPGMVTAATRLLLANALWVRMRWTSPFDPGLTAERDFHSPGGVRAAATMLRTGRLPHAAASGWRMVTLDGGEDLALDVLLPDDPAVPPVPSGDVLTALYRAARPTEVALALPRFEISHDTDLSGPLAAAGVRALFTDAADLSGVSAAPLRVDKAVHKALLRVDEEGAEGAAATAVIALAAAMSPPRPVPFTVDRPFGFVLRRREAVLFLGSVTAPDDPGPA
jgi:serpin B